MRKSYYLFLSILALIIVAACSKALQELEQKDLKIDQIKQHFYSKNLDTALMQIKTGTDEFRQELAWEKVASTTNDETNLYYIPVIWKNNSASGALPTETNYKSFLIVKEKEDAYEFLTARYFEKDSTNSFDKPTTEFSGKVIVQDYYGSANIGTFQNGIKRLDTDRKIMSTGIPGTIPICYDRYICTYSGSCVNSGVTGGAYITATESNGGCMPPAPIACPFFEWVIVNTSSFPVCEDIVIPPMPPGGWSGTIPSPVQNAIQSLVKKGVILGSTTKRLLQEALDDCLGKVVISRLSSNKKTLYFEENPSLPTPAAYDPRTETLKIDNTGAGLQNIMEELIHAYQDVKYNGITKYLDNGIPGAQNIEYEVKVLYDIRQSLNPTDQKKLARYGYYALGSKLEYLDWLETITVGGTKYPDNFETIKTNYFEFLKEFGKYNPKYKNLVHDLNLEPKVMFDLLKDADCL